MQRDNHVFFRAIQRQEITGNKKTINLGKQAEKQAVVLINQLKSETELSNQLIYLDQIKKLALLKVKTALRFYKEYCENNIFEEMETNNAMNAAYEEIGCIHENPEFLCEAFYRNSCFRQYNPEQAFPSLQKAFACLTLATKLKGNDATFASYIFAYLYSGELGFYNDRSRHLGTLSNLYYEFMSPLLELTSDEKYKIKKTKNIDYDIIRLEGEIFFANMGSRDAINNLIEIYEHGREEFNIVANPEESNKWQQKLQKLPEFLIKKYREHFEVALQNTKKYGYCNGNRGRAPNYLDYTAPKNYLPLDMLYFINVLGQINTGSSSYVIQSYYKQGFVAEAESGNISACLYLAYYELRCNKPEAAKIWYKKILETDYSIYIDMPYEIITAARSCWEYALNEGLPESEADQLLKAAADLGCFDSALLFASKHLEKNSNAEAIKYFDLALKHPHSDIPKQISEILKEFISDEIAIYRISVLGEGIKRYSLCCLETLIGLIFEYCNQEMKDSSKKIYTLMKKEMFVNDDHIDELITKTIQSYKECTLGQMRRLSL